MLLALVDVSKSVSVEIVYVKIPVSLSVMPDLKALAFIVVVVVTVIGSVYMVLLPVGSLPFVVYLMVAPDVEQLR
jgi:hypothetical protein